MHQDKTRSGCTLNRKYFIMRYADPVTGKRLTRSTRATTRREAERAAAKWEVELQEGRYQAPCNMSWKEFRERYESEKLANLAKATGDSASTAMNHLERLVDPRNLTVLTSTVFSKFQAKMRQEGMRETTIATHLRHLRAALSWAVSMELLPVRTDACRRAQSPAGRYGNLGPLPQRALVVGASP